MARTAIADMFDRGRLICADLSAGMGSALSRDNLDDVFLCWLISLTKTNGAASDAGGLLNASIARLQRRSSDDD